MKISLGTAALSIALISMAGTNNSNEVSNEFNTTAVYQDTVPKKDTSKKDKKKERRDTMYYRY